MKLKSLSAALLLSMGLVSVGGSAQAVNYVEIDGTNIKFLYDADFWGMNTAKVTGNSISFDVGSDYKVAAKVKPSSTTGAAAQTYEDSSTTGLIAVAQNGYQLQGLPSVVIAGNYTLSANGGVVSGGVGGYIYQGNFAGGVFNYEGWAGNYGIQDIHFSSGVVGSGVYDESSYIGDPWTRFSALQLNTGLSSSAQQSGPGASTSVVTKVTYDFAMAVPEPETYAMLLVGLGLVGLIARRRKGNA